MTKPPFRLVHRRISHDTVQALEEWLEEARRGDLIGIAAGLMRKDRTYDTDAAGECRRNPGFARGIIMALNDKLGKWAGSR